MSFEQFPSHWQLLPIAETVDALIDYRGKTPKKTNSGIPLITAKIVKGGTVLPATEYIAEEDYDSWMVRGFPQAGDVVVTTEAPLGEVAQLNDPNVALAQRIVTLRGAKGLLLNDYLRYVMQGSYVQSQMESRATGSTVKGIKQSELRKVLLPIPSLQEQSAIASCLKYLDKKIQHNHKINQTLEQMAQALFKSWFVDFEPVKAKIAVLEAGGTSKDATLAAMTAISGMDGTALAVFAREQPEQYAELKATAELFPAVVQDSELGEIPQGWDVGPLSDITNFVTGKISLPELTVDTYISTENMLENKSGVSRASSLPSVSTVPVFNAGHVLISNIRPYFKKIWLARFSGGRSADVLAFENKKHITVEYLYNLLYQDSFFDFMMQTSKGVKMPRGDKTAIMGWLCIRPDEKIAKAFSTAVSTYYSYIESHNSENKSLSELRDALLPKLLSGEITLPEAEAWTVQTEPQEA